MSSINMFLSSNFPIWGFYPTRLRTFCKSLDGWLVVTGIFDSTKFPAKFGGSVIVLAEMRFFAGEGGCARSSASAGSALEGIAGEATNKLRRDSWSWKFSEMMSWKPWKALKFWIYHGKQNKTASVMQNKTRLFVHDPHLLPMSRLDMPSRVDSCLRILDPIFTCSLALFTTVVSRIL